MVEPPMVVNETDESPKASLRHRMEYGALRVALVLVRPIPVTWLAGAGARLMRLVGPRLRQHRRALANLAIAFPEKTAAERDAIAKAMWANMGRTFAETLVLDRLVATPGAIEIVDHDAWARRAAEPKPLVGCTLHLGSWEIAIVPLKLFGRKPTGVYRPLDNPLIDAWLVKTRAELYPGGLFGKGDDEGRAGQRTARQLIDKARSGHALGFVCDHFDRRGEDIAFMGRTSRFTTAPALIARHVGARLWLGRAMRIGNESRFKLEITEVPIASTKDKRADGHAAAVAMFAQFEHWIRETPEQWMWWNTRWVEPQLEPNAKAPAESA